MKTAKYFLIRCRKCGNDMKYMTYGSETELSKKKKRCVYCGFTNNAPKTIIADSSR